MSPQASIAFDKQRAATYDERAAVWAPTRETLHWLMRLILADQPAQARVLCVGAGTGAEILAMAEAFPSWQFTAVDPAGAMLELCRQKSEARGIAERCRFHEGYIDSLPVTEPFDIATSLLVSQFILDREERHAFFRNIASRLHPGGMLISSDLAADLSAPTFIPMLEVWMKMQKQSGYSAQDLEKMREAYGTQVAVVPPAEVEAIIGRSGFEAPVLFHQTLLIHAWFARRNSRRG